MSKTLISLAMAILVLGFAASVQANTIYDFNGLSKGPLHNNGGWTFDLGSSDNVTVDDAAVPGWLGTGKYVLGGPTQSYLAWYKHANDFTWLQNNVAFDISVMTFFTDGGRSQIGAAAMMSNTLSANDYLLMGVVGDSTSDRLGWYIGNYWRGGSGAGYVYEYLDFTGGGSKSLRVGVSFTPSGLNDGKYSVQRYYINLTDAPNTVVNVGTPWTSVAIADIGTVWTQFRIGAMSGDGAPGMIDDIRITQVPEPGTLVLLAAGLFGLLAYAWRKRK